MSGRGKRRSLLRALEPALVLRAIEPAVVLRALEPALVLLAIFAAWEAATRGGLFDPREIPAMTTILGELIADVQTSELWKATWETAWASLLGLLIAIAAAIPIGMLLGSYSPAYRAVRLLVEFVRPIPMVATLPLLILLYGTGVRLAMVLVVVTAFWPVLVQTMYGVQDVDPVARDTGRAYGLGTARRFVQIVLPSALPYIATGVRLSALLALVVAIGASLVAGGAGLGAAIGNAQGAGEVALMYARIIVAGLLGLVVALAVAQLERRLLHWHHSHRPVRT